MTRPLLTRLLSRIGLTPMLFAACLSLSYSEELYSQEAIVERIDRLARPFVDHEIVNGMVIGVIHEGQKTVKGYGVISAEQDRTPDGDTIYEIGSISKAFTGVLLADAIVRGHVRLDQPLQELLPDGVSMPTHDGQSITLLHLATHTSGLPRLADNMPFGIPDNPYADYTTDLMHVFLSGHELRRAPGKEIEYSNFAMGLLGTVLAHQQETTYESLLRERIATPLGMNSTVIELTPDLQSRLAPPHSGDRAPVSNWDLLAHEGAGGIRATVNDLLLFVQANLAPPADELGKAIELAWRIHQPPISANDFAIGLGWHVAKDGRTRWHNGQTGGYHSMALVSREIPAAVVLLSNTATGEVDGLAEDIVRMLAGAEVEPRKFEQTATVSPDVMKRYVGKYQIIPQFVLTVSVDDDKLMVGATGQPTFQVFPRSDTEWFYKVVDATLTFKVDDDGACRELDLFQNGIHQAAKRVE